MAKHVFKMPDIGEGVVEGEVVQWHVSVGDSVSEDAPIVDMMTDKATVTIPAPTGGVVTSISGDVGDMVAVGSMLVEFETDADSSTVADSGPVSESDASIEPEPMPAPIAEPAPAPAPAPAPVPATAQAPPPVVATTKTTNGKALASPAVRKRALEAGVELDTVSGSGPAGRVRHADLDAFIAAGGTVPGAAPTAFSTNRSGITEVKVVGLRRKIAEQMVKSKTSIPHFSFFEEVDVTELEELRQMLNSSKHDSQPKLSYLPFIILALAKIMPEHPECNAHRNASYVASSPASQLVP